MILRCRALIGNLTLVAEEDSGHRMPAGMEHAMHEMPDALVMVPWAIVILALLVALRLLVRWNFRGRPDPLADVPRRPNTLAEDAVLIAMGVYFLAVSLLSLISMEVMDDPRGTGASILVGNGGQFMGGLTCLLIAHRRFTGGWQGLIFGASTDAEATAVQLHDPRSPDADTVETDGHVQTSNRGGATAAQPGACGSAADGRDQLPSAVTRQARKVTVVTLLLAVGLCPLIAEGTVWLYRLFRPDDGIPSHPTLSALGSGAEPWYAVVMLWIGAALIAPVAEELFFRGLLQTWLAHRLSSRWRALGLAALAFGLAHTGQPQAIPALVTLAVMLGFAYERTGMLIVPVVIHAGFNLNTLIWQALSTAYS